MLFKKSFMGLLLGGVSLLASCTSAPSLGQDLTQREVLFNGQNLDNWDYDQRLWHLQADGSVKGETNAQNKARSNTFLISKDHSYADFEIELDYKLTTINNSGVIYRCKQIGREDFYRVSGYQAEGENDMTKGGFMYDEARRGWIASPGELVLVNEKGAKQIIGAVNRPVDLVQQKFLNDKQWNHYRIVARGNHFMHYINGHLSVEVIDRDPKNSSRRGAVALQIHQGKPMTVFFRDVVVNRFKSEFGQAQILLAGTLAGWAKEDVCKIELPHVPSSNPRWLKGRGAKGSSFAAPQLNLQGKVSRQLPAGDGIVRFHQKGAMTLQLGGHAILLPVVKKAQVDGFVAVEVLVRGESYEVTSAGKVISFGKLSGRELGFNSNAAFVRNILWLPLLPKK